MLLKWKYFRTICREAFKLSFLDIIRRLFPVFPTFFSVFLHAVVEKWWKASAHKSQWATSNRNDLQSNTNPTIQVPKVKSINRCTIEWIHWFIESNRILSFRSFRRPRPDSSHHKAPSVCPPLPSSSCSSMVLSYWKFEIFRSLFSLVSSFHSYSYLILMLQVCELIDF